MIDVTFIAMIVGTAATILMIIWLDRRREKKFNRRDARHGSIATKSGPTGCRLKCGWLTPK